MRSLRLLFVTDLHGSEMCYRKFLNALKIYKVHVGVVTGDLTGKFIVPIIERPDGTYFCEFLGQRTVIKEKEKLKELEWRIASTGSYHYYTTPEEFESLKAEGKTIEGRIDEKRRRIVLLKGKIEELFIKLVCERLEHWLQLAEERLKGTGIKVYMYPGNDDIYEIDEVLNRSTFVIPTDGRKVEVNGHEMISLAASNPTPWDTPREFSEEELDRKIEELTTQIKDMKNAIFNFHVPPYGTMLDEAPKLSKDLVPSVKETISAGSIAVLEAIKTHQPLLGLHGHIHESRGIQKVGRTVCVNPGSEYTEGILRGIILTLEKNKVKNFLFTSG